MANISVLNIKLYGNPIGTLTRVEGDRSLFAFNEEYVADNRRPTLGLGFKDNLGELLTDFRPYKTKIMPFFSNLLPEGHLREYLSKNTGVNAQREFFLLWVLGQDLPGAITVTPADDEDWPPDAKNDLSEQDEKKERRENALRFSLAGVQLKFSAVHESTGGLTIPAKGIGGSWIIKLPSAQFEGVPENEYSMMTLARQIGMDVPPVKLVNVSDINNMPEGLGNIAKKSALAIERFDRLSDGSAVHIEDFAQIFGLYPADKYNKASAVNIADVIRKESHDKDIAEFVRRLTFNTLIGNADMHVKNWSMIYPDRRNAVLAPAYDFVSTIPYIPDQEAALKFSRTKRFDQYNEDELTHLAARSRLPKNLVLETAHKTQALFYQHWQQEKQHLPLTKDVIQAIEKHRKTIQLG